MFVVLTMENALDTQAPTPHHGSEQSSHPASILMDIFNVTLLTAALKLGGGWFVVRMVANVQAMMVLIPGVICVFSVMVMKPVLKF